MPLIAIDGDKRAGKTALMTKLLKKDSDNGIPIHANYQLYFGEPYYFHVLHEIFGLRNCSIGISDGQRLMDVRRFMSLPPQFSEMVAATGHDHVNLYVDTQDIYHIDKRVRDNIDVYYHVKRFLRWPPTEEDAAGRPLPALFQISRYWRHEKRHTPSGLVRWHREGGQWLFISRWQKKLYETHEKLSLSAYVWKLIRKNKKNRLLVVSRSLIESGKARL